MSRNEPTSRPDRILFVALAIVLATVSAVVGSAMNAPAPAPAAVVAAAPRLPNAQEMVLAEHRCLTEALYYEARSEGASGEKAVAEVVFHRLNSGRYGDSVCAVVHEGADGKVCQFSFVCNGDMKRPREIVAWNALARVSQHGTSAEKAKVRAKVHAKYPAIGKSSR